MLLKKITVVFLVPINREAGSADDDGSVAHYAEICPHSLRSARIQFIKNDRWLISLGCSPSSSCTH